MPAVRVFYLLAATTVLALAGVIEPILARVALGLDGGLVLALLVDLWRARRAVSTAVSAERHWPPLLVQGGDAEVRVEIRNDGPRRLRLRLRDTLHPALAEAPRRSEHRLEPEMRQEWVYTVCPRRRGEHVAGPLVARCLGPWGLAWWQKEILPAEPRRIYPQVRWEGRVGQLLLLAHRHALGANPLKIEGLGREPYGVREYLPGDPLSRIHWKSTARHGRLVTREDTWERGARLVILLDTARSMSGRDGARSKLDHALAASLALVRVAVSRGDRVTFLAFSDRIERSLRLHGGARALHTAYASLYDLDARAAEPAFDIAAETAIGLETRRSTVVLFTSVVDLAAAELLRQAVLRLERRHRPILINLEDPELVHLAELPPETVEGAFAQTAALEIQLMNRGLAKRLRHAGIRVVQTSADRLALEALEAYLAMFR